MAVPTSTSIAAICTRCWNAASRPERSRSIINWLICRRRAARMRLVFANGAAAEADIVIGADGIRSKVREFVLGPEPPQFVGAVAYRAIFPAERLNGLEIPDCTKWWGADRHCLPYYLTGRRDEVYAIGVVPAAGWDRRRSLGADDPRAVSGIVRGLSCRSAARAARRRQREPVADLRPRAQRSLEQRPHAFCSATPVIRCGRSWRRAAPWRSRTAPS